MPRLLRCLFWKSASWRAAKSSGFPGRSIRTTLAPQSASWRTHTGPARACVMSMTVSPSRAREAGVYPIVLFVLLLGNDRSRAIDKMLGRGQHLVHGVLERLAANRIDLNSRRRCSLDELGILQSGIEGVAQRLHALGRHVGRRGKRLAERIAGDDQGDDLPIVIVARQLLNGWDVELIRLRLGLHQKIDLLLRKP